MRTFAKLMEALQSLPQSDLRDQVIAHAQMMQPSIHDGEDGDGNWYLACLDGWAKDIQSDIPWRRKRAQGIIELLKRVQDHLMVGAELHWGLAMLDGKDVGLQPRFSDGSVLDISQPSQEKTLIAKTPLDEIALSVYGMYLLDLDLLEQKKPGSDEYQKLLQKTEAEKLLIAMCQQWSGKPQQDGEGYLAAEIRDLVDPDVRREIVAILQEAGFLKAP